MFYNTQRIITGANRLAAKNSVLYTTGVLGKPKDFIPLFSIGNKQHFNTTAPVHATYAAAAQLPIPVNIDPTETTRFSPQRSRDISATVILSNHSQLSTPIDITVDNSSQDPHVQSYDCFGAVSLNSAMQSNVPTPFGGMHKFTHLNMPGGQWSQEGKFISQNLQSSHYTALRNNARSTWLSYDQDAVVKKIAE